MPEINHVFHISAGKEKVYAQLNSVAGLSAWWTEDTHGEASQGGEVEFRFNGNALCKVNVQDESGPDRLAWKVSEGHPEWVGTEITFDLSENEGKTRIAFAHKGWEEQNDFYAQCNFSWGRYMVSLRDLCEKGKGDPWAK